MKITFTISLIGSALLLFVVIPAAAIPLDWTGFGPYDASDPVDRIDDRTIVFSEDTILGAVYYFNTAFLVPDDAFIFSFNYDITLGSASDDDFLTVDAYDEAGSEIFYAEFPEFMSGGPLSGYFEFDLSAYRRRTIELAWGLLDGDFEGGVDSAASVYNIDLSTTGITPIPEPASIFLMGTGLIGLLGIGSRIRRKLK